MELNSHQFLKPLVNLPGPKLVFQGASGFRDDVIFAALRCSLIVDSMKGFTQTLFALGGPTFRYAMASATYYQLNCHHRNCKQVLGVSSLPFGMAVFRQQRPTHFDKHANVLLLF